MKDPKSVRAPPSSDLNSRDMFRNGSSPFNKCQPSLGSTLHSSHPGDYPCFLQISPLGDENDTKVDAMACLQVSEDGGVVIEWICGNPITLGVQGNAVDWLMKGVSAICGKKLDLPVSIAKNARGEYGSSNDDRNKKEEKR